MNETTLRDQFAMAYLNGYAANPAWGNLKPIDISREAYRHADAMLAARNGTEFIDPETGLNDRPAIELDEDHLPF